MGYENRYFLTELELFQRCVAEEFREPDTILKQTTRRRSKYDALASISEEAFKVAIILTSQALRNEFGHQLLTCLATDYAVGAFSSDIRKDLLTLLKFIRIMCTLQRNDVDFITALLHIVRLPQVPLNEEALQTALMDIIAVAWTDGGGLSSSEAGHIWLSTLLDTSRMSHPSLSSSAAYRTSLLLALGGICMEMQLINVLSLETSPDLLFPRYPTLVPFIREIREGQGWPQSLKSTCARFLLDRFQVGGMTGGFASDAARAVSYFEIIRDHAVNFDSFDVVERTLRQRAIDRLRNVPRNGSDANFMMEAPAERVEFLISWAGSVQPDIDDTFYNKTIPFRCLKRLVQQGEPTAKAFLCNHHGLIQILLDYTHRASNRNIPEVDEIEFIEYGRLCKWLGIRDEEIRSLKVMIALTSSIIFRRLGKYSALRGVTCDIMRQLRPMLL